MSWEIIEGDCVEVMAAMDECSVDAVVCDPPYSLGFMGRSWDSHGEGEDAGFGYYLAGLIDGEGHFRVGAGERRCEFGMKMRADDEWILRQAIGFIRHGRIAREPRRDGSAPQAKLVIDTKDGCAALCALLMRYPLRAKKLRDFLTWAEAVDEWLSMPRGNRWHGPADRARLAELGARLREGRNYSEVPWSGNAFQDWCRVWGREALRVLKPGGHCLAFGGTRTYHRLTAGLEDAGFEIRDTVAFMYGSGFPKSLDVSKAIDAAAGAEREVVGPGRWNHVKGSNDLQADCLIRPGGQHDETAPATPDAERWQGWGTALKPAHEPIVVARKPLAGTVAGNVLAHGTGALNVDGCRIEGVPEKPGNVTPHVNGNGVTHGAMTRDPADYTAPSGRWPANVVLDPDAAALLDSQTGEMRDGTAVGGLHSASGSNAIYARMERVEGAGDHGYGGSGGASRFMYVAKASSAERSAGLDGKIGVCRCHEANTEASPPRATDEHDGTDDTRWSTSGSGSRPTDPSPTDSRSTIETATSRTTTSPTSNSSPPPSTSDCIPRTTDETTPESGSDAATSAANGSRPTPSTTTSAVKAGPSTDGVDRATSHKSSPPSSSAVCADCGGVVGGAWKNTHPLEPTVKPVALMRWLVRLVTPPGGLVLDPFTGSGTTGCAAVLEGFRFVGIEREPEYAQIARARIAWWAVHPDGMELVDRLEAEKKRKQMADIGQGELFT